MDEIIGFSLSQEELLALLLIGQIPIPIGFDDLEERVWGNLTDEMKGVLFTAVERGLLARGFLNTVSEKLIIDNYVKQVLQLCATPDYTWLIIHQPVGQLPRSSYFHQRDDLYLGHIATVGIHQFIQLTNTQEIVEIALQLVDPLPVSESSEMNGKLKEDVFSAIITQANELTTNLLNNHLQKGGLSDEIAQAFTTTLQTLTSITAFGRLRHSDNSYIETVFTIVRGTNEQWVLSASDDPGLIQLRPITGAAAKQLLRQFGNLIA